MNQPRLQGHHEKSTKMSIRFQVQSSLPFVSMNENAGYDYAHLQAKVDEILQDKWKAGIVGRTEARVPTALVPRSSTGVVPSRAECIRVSFASLLFFRFLLFPSLSSQYLQVFPTLSSQYIPRAESGESEVSPYFWSPAKLSANEVGCSSNSVV